jgi:hypothetical protein
MKTPLYSLSTANWRRLAQTGAAAVHKVRQSAPVRQLRHSLIGVATVTGAKRTGQFACDAGGRS